MRIGPRPRLFGERRRSGKGPGQLREAQGFNPLTREGQRRGLGRKGQADLLDCVKGSNWHLGRLEKEVGWDQSST